MKYHIPEGKTIVVNKLDQVGYIDGYKPKQDYDNRNVYVVHFLDGYLRDYNIYDLTVITPAELRERLEEK